MWKQHFEIEKQRIGKTKISVNKKYSSQKASSYARIETHSLPLKKYLWKASSNKKSWTYNEMICKIEYKKLIFLLFTIYSLSKKNIVIHSDHRERRTELSLIFRKWFLKMNEISTKINKFTGFVYNTLSE